MVQSDFWNKLKARLREVSIAAADFTEEQALIGKLKFDILNLKRKIEHKQSEIGVRICELSLTKRPKPKPFEDEDIIRLLSEIAELEVLVDQKRQDITKVADQVRSRDKKEPGVKKTVVQKPDATTKKPRKKPGPQPGTKKKKPGPKPGAKKKKPGPKPGSKRKTTTEQPSEKAEKNAPEKDKAPE